MAGDVLHDGDGALSDERDQHRVEAYAVARDAQARRRGLVTVLCGPRARRMPLNVPDLEAPSVKLSRHVACQTRPLHQHLRCGQHHVARVAKFPIAGTPRDSGKAVGWQVPFPNLAPDEKADSLSIHRGLSDRRRIGRSQIHRSLDASRRQPVRPRCRQGQHTAEGSVLIAGATRRANGPALKQ